MFSQAQEEYIKTIVQEFIAEFKFLADVKAGRAQRKRKFTDKLLKLLETAARVLPGVTSVLAIGRNFLDLCFGPKSRRTDLSGLEEMKACGGAAGAAAMRRNHTQMQLIVDVVLNNPYDEVALEIILTDIARTAARRYEFFIERLCSSNLNKSVIPFAVVGVERMLEYIIRNHLPITRENLLLGLYLGQSGGWISSVRNQYLESRDSSVTKLTAEGAYRRSPFFIREDGSYWVCDEGEKNARTKLVKSQPKYGVVLIDRDDWLDELARGFRAWTDPLPTTVKTYVASSRCVYITRKAVEDYAVAYHRGSVKVSLREYIGKEVICRDDLADLDLSDLDLSRVDFTGVNFSGCNLSGCVLNGAYLLGAILVRANLTKAKLNDAILWGADCSNAVFKGAYLLQARCEFANFSATDLSGVKIIGAEWYQADLTQIKADDGVIAELTKLQQQHQLLTARVGIQEQLLRELKVESAEQSVELKRFVERLETIQDREAQTAYQLQQLYGEITYLKDLFGSEIAESTYHELILRLEKETAQYEGFQQSLRTEMGELEDRIKTMVKEDITKVLYQVALMDGRVKGVEFQQSKLMGKLSEFRSEIGARLTRVEDELKAQHTILAEHEMRLKSQGELMAAEANRVAAHERAIAELGIGIREMLGRSVSVSRACSLSVVDSLKQRYTKTGFLYIERMLGGEGLALREYFITLTLVKEAKERKPKQAREVDAATAGAVTDGRELEEGRSSFAAISEVKESLALERLLVKGGSESKDPKKVLVLGNPGIGKTTLCRYLASEWAHGEKWQEFQAVFLVPLRELIGLKGEDLTTVRVIRSRCLGGDEALRPSEEELKDFLEKQVDKILWILDGYDEIASLVIQPEHYKLCDFLESVFHYPYVLLTSRPNVNVDRIAGFAPSYDRRLEITGFIDENVEIYVKKVMPEEAEGKLAVLKSNPSVWGVAHVPLNLDLLCSTDTFANTITELYTKLVEVLLKRYRENIRRQGRSETELKSKVEFIEQALAILAYQGIKTNQILISRTAQRDFLRFLRGFSLPIDVLLEEVLKSGLVVKMANETLYFIHLTFQEYFAANFIAQQIITASGEKAALTAEVVEFIAHEKYTPHCEVVMWFIAGILYQYHKQNDDELPLLRFFDLIQSKPRELVGMHHAALLIRCLEECEGGESLTAYEELMNDVMPWLEVSVRGDFLERNTLGRALILSVRVQRSRRFITFWIEKLSGLEFTQVEWYVRSGILTSLEAVDYLVRNLRDGKRNFYLDPDFAVDALVELGQKIPEIITYLFSILRDSNKSVHFIAAEALGMLGQGTPEVIAGLLGALRDSQWKAAQVLGMLGQGTPEVIAGLLGALRDGKAGVRYIVAKALVKLGQGMPEVIAGLLGVLRDGDVLIRQAAVNVLGELKQGTPEVIAGLFGALRLRDSDFSVHDAVVKALVKLGQKTPAVLADLFSALRDGNLLVRQAAVNVLGELKQGTPEVIAGLFGALRLRDSDFSVHNAVAEALVKLGQKASAVLADLLSALRDSDEHICSVAAKVLGELGQGTPEVIAELLGALRLWGGNYSVRNAIAKALVKLGQGIPEVIAGLLDVLRDSKEDVRWAAAEVLGELGQGGTPEVIAELLGALRNSGNKYVCKNNVVRALIKLRQGTSEVIAALLSDLRGSKECSVSSICAFKTRFDRDRDLDGKMRDRIVAMEALGKLKQGTPEVIAALLGVLRDIESELNKIVAEMEEKWQLQYIESKRDKVIVELDKKCELRSASYRQNRELEVAVKVLEELGQGTPEVIAGLLGVLRNSDEKVCKVAVKALVTLGQGTPEVIAGLLDVLRHSYGGYGKVDEVAAAEALGELGQGTPEIVTGLLVFGSSDVTFDQPEEVSEVEKIARKALVKLGQRTSEVIACLFGVLRDKDEMSTISRPVAMRTLEEFMQPAASVSPTQLQGILEAARALGLSTTVYEAYLGQATLGLRALAEFESQATHSAFTP